MIRERERCYHDVVNDMIALVNHNVENYCTLEGAHNCNIEVLGSSHIMLPIKKLKNYTFLERLYYLNFSIENKRSALDANMRHALHSGQQGYMF